MKLKLPDRTLEAELAYRNDFTSFDDFWREGGREAYVEDGKLIVKTDLERGKDAGFVVTVFCRQHFEGNLVVEYRVQSPHADSHRNFNFFIHTTMPDGRDLFGTRSERTGSYPEYHALSNYLFTSLPSSDTEVEGSTVMRHRMRRNPGFRLMKEAQGYACENFRWYTFRYLVKDGEVRIYVDNDPVESYAWRDPEPLTEGLIGFRSFCSQLEYKELKVFKI